MRRFVPLLVSLLILTGLLLSPLFQTQPVRSVELSIAEHSPLGVAGGTVVPASCPSYDHFSGLGGVCGECLIGQVWFNPPGGPDYCFWVGCPTGYHWDAGSSTCQPNPPPPPPPPPPPTPPVVTITPPGGTPGPTATVIVGETVTITWSCPAPNTSSSGVNFSTGGAVSGSTGVVVTTDTTYTTSEASVNAIAIDPNISLVADKSRVRINGTAVLTWSASGVTSCSLSGPGTTDSATAVSGSIASRDKTTAAITGQSTYTLTCQTELTPVSTSVTVLLIPNTIEI